MDLLDINYQEPYQYEVYNVPGAVDLGYLATISGTDTETLQDMNPELTQLSTPPDFEGGYPLKIPKGSLNSLLHKCRIFLNLLEEHSWFTKLEKVRISQKLRENME